MQRVISSLTIATSNINSCNTSCSNFSDVVTTAGHPGLIHNYISKNVQTVYNNLTSLYKHYLSSIMTSITSLSFSITPLDKNQFVVYISLSKAPEEVERLISILSTCMKRIEQFKSWVNTYLYQHNFITDIFANPTYYMDRKNVDAQEMRESINQLQKTASEISRIGNNLVQRINVQKDLYWGLVTTQKPEWNISWFEHTVIKTKEPMQKFIF